jgi:hypothetical protein
MSRRLGLRLVPDRVADDVTDAQSEAERLHDQRLDQIADRVARDDKDLRDQPPALGTTPAATPSE